jgi:RimJ/RimL family protein N-acetyltransferase
LSKLYVKKEFRGKQIGKATLHFIDAEAKQNNLKSIQLKVNKYNTKSIEAYEKLGFKKVKATITDIGNGFVMDDYEMVKVI